MKKLLLLSTIMLLPWSESAYAVTVKVDDQPETATITTTATTYTPQRQAPHLDENTKTLLKLMYEEKQLRKLLYREQDLNNKKNFINLKVQNQYYKKEYNFLKVNIFIEEILINNLEEQLKFTNNEKKNTFLKKEIENRKTKDRVEKYFKEIIINPWNTAHRQEQNLEIMNIKNMVETDERTFKIFKVIKSYPFTTVENEIVMNNDSLNDSMRDPIQELYINSLKSLNKFEEERGRQLRKLDFKSIKINDLKNIIKEKIINVKNKSTKENEIKFLSYINNLKDLENKEIEINKTFISPYPVFFNFNNNNIEILIGIHTKQKEYIENNNWDEIKLSKASRINHLVEILGRIRGAHTSIALKTYEQYKDYRKRDINLFPLSQ